MLAALSTIHVNCPYSPHLAISSLKARHDPVTEEVMPQQRQA